MAVLTMLTGGGRDGQGGHTVHQRLSLLGLCLSGIRRKHHGHDGVPAIAVATMLAAASSRKWPIELSMVGRSGSAPFINLLLGFLSRCGLVRGASRQRAEGQELISSRTSLRPRRFQAGSTAWIKPASSPMA